jgi:hypothetical protein
VTDAAHLLDIIAGVDDLLPRLNGLTGVAPLRRLRQGLDDLRALAHQPSTQLEYVVHKAVAGK